MDSPGVRTLSRSIIPPFVHLVFLQAPHLDVLGRLRKNLCGGATSGVSDILGQGGWRLVNRRENRDPSIVD